MGKRGPGVSQRRLPAAQRKQQRAEELWAAVPLTKKERKLAHHCVVCDAVINYNGLKLQYKKDYQLTIGDDTFYWCLGCANRNPKRIAQMTYVLLRFAGAKCPHRTDENHSKKTCHTIQCTTRRLVRV